MRLRIILGLGWTILLFLISCQPIQNYEAEDSPYFAANYALPDHPVGDHLKVITWNIKFAREVDQAIRELREVEMLQDADVLLLQEMDEKGVDKIARELKYNYVYFPASIHSEHDNNFGNAILTKWPLSMPEKIILPHENPKNAQIRVATKAITTIDNLEISLYSVHTETIWLSDGKRMEQVDKIVAGLEDDTFVFVGGDFNSASTANIATLDEKFEEVNMERVSKGAEPTVEIGGVGFTADHIYARDVQLIENGVWSATQASDHYPVWIDASLSHPAMCCE